MKRFFFVFVAMVVVGCSSGSEGTAGAAASIATTTGSPLALDPASSTPSASASVEPTPAATPVPSSPPASAPIVLKGKETRKTKPFKMVSPATVDLAFTGTGNFISSIVPVGGGALDGVHLSNTIGKTKFRTYIYGDQLDGVSSYADVLASSGSWTITITPGAPAAKPAPASFTGKWGLNTTLVHLQGDYTVTFTHAGSGNFIVYLVPPAGSLFDGEQVTNEIGKVKDSTEVYGLDGDYYFQVTADGAWTIEIKAQ